MDPEARAGAGAASGAGGGDSRAIAVSPGRKSTSRALKSACSDGSIPSVSTFFDSGGRSYGGRSSAPIKVIWPAKPRSRSSAAVRSPARPAPATTTRPPSATVSIIQNQLARNTTLRLRASGTRRLPTPHAPNNRKIIAMDDTLADPLAGRLLDGRYAVTSRIAHGGMATVYLAIDTRLDREVALKVMHAELARDDEFVRRFIGEAKSVARLSHQNVVAVFDQGADGPFLYLAMEYVPVRTLKELLRDSGRFPPATALEIMAGVLDGLAAAHASGIVHRDVKPENVLVTADGRVKVADFGLARAQSAAGHTRAGLLIGTVAYVPPEQVTGETTGPRGDVYSAGVMLFELLTGRQPFTGDTPLSIAYQHVNSGVPAPSTVAPGIPAAVDQLVLAATGRDPAQRPADAGEFLRAVRHVRERLPEPSGLTGMVGVGAQGLAEAPWLDLNTP